METILEISHEKMERIIEGEGTCDGCIYTGCKLYCKNPDAGNVTALYIDAEGRLWLEVFNTAEQAIEWLKE